MTPVFPELPHQVPHSAHASPVCSPCQNCSQTYNPHFRALAPVIPSTWHTLPRAYHPLHYIPVLDLLQMSFRGPFAVRVSASIIFKTVETSLSIQWLGFHTLTTKCLSSVSSQITQIQQAPRHSKKKKFSDLLMCLVL